MLKEALIVTIYVGLKKSDNMRRTCCGQTVIVVGQGHGLVFASLGAARWFAAVDGFRKPGFSREIFKKKTAKTTKNNF